MSLNKYLLFIIKNPLQIFKGLNFLVHYIINNLFYKNFGFGSIVKRQLVLQNVKYISVGKSVLLMRGRVELIDKYAGKDYQPQLSILDNSQIHQNCHITCADDIHIGAYVIIVSNVTITDIIHPHDNVNLPISHNQIMTRPVFIDDNCYIYNNVVILPGTRIGKNCIIGANSVVRGEIPDYSIAVGNPAKVVKRYNFETKRWDKI